MCSPISRPRGSIKSRKLMPVPLIVRNPKRRSFTLSGSLRHSSSPKIFSCLVSSALLGWSRRMSRLAPTTATLVNSAYCIWLDITPFIFLSLESFLQSQANDDDFNPFMCGPCLWPPHSPLPWTGVRTSFDDPFYGRNGCPRALPFDLPFNFYLRRHVF